MFAFTAERNSRAARDRELRIFIYKLWVGISETATVQRNGHIIFLFKDRASIEVGAE